MRTKLLVMQNGQAVALRIGPERGRYIVPGAETDIYLAGYRTQSEWMDEIAQALDLYDKECFETFDGCARLRRVWHATGLTEEECVDALTRAGWEVQRVTRYRRFVG